MLQCYLLRAKYVKYIARSKSLFIPKSTVFAKSTSFFTLHNDISIPLHEFTAITGSSGCGKTSLIQVLCHLLSLKSGMSDEDPVLIPPDELAYMPQSGSLFEMSIIDNILYPHTSSNSDINKQKLQEILSILDLVGLSANNSLNPSSQLSGGQIQRVKLARCLYNDANYYKIE